MAASVAQQQALLRIVPPSANTTSASDLQFIIERLMSAQKQNGGVIFLSSDSLPPSFLASLLQGGGLPASSPAAALAGGEGGGGGGCCLAGVLNVFYPTDSVAADGPELWMRFSVADSGRCRVRRAYDALRGRWCDREEDDDASPQALALKQLDQSVGAGAAVNGTRGGHSKGGDPRDLVLKTFTMEFPAHEGPDRLMTSPSPMKPVIN